MKRFRKLNPEFELSCVCNIIHILLHTRRLDRCTMKTTCHKTRQDQLYDMNHNRSDNPARRPMEVSNNINLHSRDENTETTCP